MAKRSQRRPLRHEKDQTGCMWGLISIFDFRHGRSARKLLADKRRGNRQAVGVGCSQTNLILPDSNGKYEDTEDAEGSRVSPAETVKTSVKILMEEEMSNEQGSANQMNDSEVGQKILNPHIRKNRWQRNKTSKKFNDMHLSDLDSAKKLEPEKSCDQIHSQKTLDNIDLEILMQELCQIRQESCSCVTHLLHDDSDMESDQVGTVDKEKLTAAVNVFIDQSLCSKHSREDGQVLQSREVMDALHQLSSNKDLFLKLLQDPNSVLVKQIKRMEETQLENDPNFNSLPASGFLKEKLTRSKTDDVINNKPRKFFRRRSRSQESYPLMGNEECQSSSKIVILKPGPAASRQPDSKVNGGPPVESHYPTGHKIQGERSQFSLTEIKRKLKHAIRKEKQGISPDGIINKSRPEHQMRRDFDKGVGGENVGWCSPNRHHFYTERFAKPSTGRRGEMIGKPNQSEVTTANDHSGFSKPGVSNIYIEAKKHLLEMISTGDDGELSSQQLPKSLGRILSLSEYDYSPSCSPRKDREDSLTSTPIRLSPSCSKSINGSPHQPFDEKIDGHPSSSNTSSESQSCLPHHSSDRKYEFPKASEGAPCNQNQANVVEEILSPNSDVKIFEGVLEIEETTETVHQEEHVIPIDACDSDCLTIVKDAKTSEAPEECDEDGLTQSLEKESVGESQVLSSPSASPSHCSVTVKVEDSEGAIDRTEKPSPVSVLDPLFAEDDISPARTVSRPVELEIQPRQIHFDEQRSSNDQGICIGTSLEDEESAFEYVEAVLLGSGLNWDEYLLRWLSSLPILDSTLYDEVELFSSRSHHEQKLLFDCTNEVLGEVCEHYFGSFLGLSCTKKNMRLAPKGMNLILEIWAGVEWHILQHPTSQSLDQLVKKDMEKSRAWMDLRQDIEHIGIDMEKAILENLVEDTISSIVYETLESNFVVRAADFTEI